MIKKYYLLALIVTTLLGAVIFSFINSNAVQSYENIQKTKQSSSIVTINSLAALNTLFAKLDYTEGNWKSKQKTVPRLSFNGIGDNWSKKSQQLPVNTKKSIFFRLLTPLTLIANEKILAEREMVKTADLSSQALLDIALKYGIVNNIGKNKEIVLTEVQRGMLLKRVDIVPPSLAVAQAAEESGWGTSRFARKGNALFGQWDFSGNGMKPLKQRKELGNYGVARFDSPLASVEGYMLNINRNNAYKKLRVLRAELRPDHNPVKGIELATTLDKYSERGQAYIDGLTAMIRFNKLEVLDRLILSDEKLIHLISDDD